MPVKAIMMSLGALLCFAAAYRFGSHGLRAKDGLCIGLACAAIAAGVTLGTCALRSKRRKLD